MGSPATDAADTRLRRMAYNRIDEKKGRAHGGTRSLKSLKRGLFGKPAQMVFEMDAKDVTDDRLELEFPYCPLVKAWQKQGCSDEEISDLCDWAMCGDCGIGEAYGCELDLPKTIARDDDVCHLICHR